MGVVIKGATYYTILLEGVCTIRWGVLIKEGALTEGVPYLKRGMFL